MAWGLCILLLVLQLFTKCNGDIVDNTSGEVMFDNVVFFTSEGVRETRRWENISVQVLDRTAQELICFNETAGFGTDTLIIHGLLGMITCNGELGTFSSGEFFAYWCSQAPIIIVETPGVERFYFNSPFFNQVPPDCTFLQARTLGEWRTKRNFTGTVTIDNDAYEIFDDIMVQITVRGVVPLLQLWLVFDLIQSLRYRVSRRKNRNVIFHVVSILEGTSLITLAGTGMWAGSHGVGHGMPLALVLTLYTELFGISVVCDMLLAMMYTEIYHALRHAQRFKPTPNYLIGAALVLGILDLGLQIYIGYYMTYNKLGFAILCIYPMSITIAQFMTFAYLGYRSYMVKSVVLASIKPGESNSSKNSDSVRNHTLLIEKNLRHCIVISGVASLFYFAIGIGINTSFHVRTPQIYLGFLFLGKVSRLLNSYARARACRPINKTRS